MATVSLSNLNATTLRDALRESIREQRNEESAPEQAAPAQSDDILRTVLVRTGPYWEPDWTGTELHIKYSRSREILVKEVRTNGRVTARDSLRGVGEGRYRLAVSQSLKWGWTLKD
ncbi:hypothetical protein ACQEU8_02530 [Streptomyces sp. CA-250714]|uniref:hypothetical protein n=1 Tax=Streptomyces sp. CA-250714 TaxID=3240060 RepID=UPI003D8DB4E7